MTWGSALVPLVILLLFEWPYISRLLAIPMSNARQLRISENGDRADDDYLPLDRLP
jgi:hypothetical protein